jgi:hypothetical protein
MTNGSTIDSSAPSAVIWTIEACTNFEGRKVVGVYTSAADALAMVAKADALHAAERWDEAWLAEADGIRLTEMRLDAEPVQWPEDTGRAFKRNKHGPRWAACGGGLPEWSGTAEELLRLLVGYQAWDECGNTSVPFRECPAGSPCSDLDGRERERCMDLGRCRGHDATIKTWRVRGRAHEGGGVLVAAETAEAALELARPHLAPFGSTAPLVEEFPVRRTGTWPGVLAVAGSPVVIRGDS